MTSDLFGDVLKLVTSTLVQLIHLTVGYLQLRIYDFKIDPL